MMRSGTLCSRRGIVRIDASGKLHAPRWLFDKARMGGLLAEEIARPSNGDHEEGITLPTLKIRVALTGGAVRFTERDVLLSALGTGARHPPIRAAPMPGEGFNGFLASGRAIQVTREGKTDLPLDDSQVGAPVFDLRGRLVALVDHRRISGLFKRTGAVLVRLDRAGLLGPLTRAVEGEERNEPPMFRGLVDAYQREDFGELRAALLARVATEEADERADEWNLAPDRPSRVVLVESLRGLDRISDNLVTATWTVSPVP